MFSECPKQMLPDVKSHGAHGQESEQGEAPGPPAQLWGVHVLDESQDKESIRRLTPLLPTPSAPVSLAAIARAGYEPSSCEP